MTTKAKAEQKPKALYVKVIYLDGREVEAFVGPRARVELERRTGTEFTKAMKLEEHIYFIAWAALYYGGLDPEADFDVWLNGIVDAGLANGEPPTPTQRAPKPASSAG